MPKWSKLQDEVLWEHGNEGARRCADIIRHRYGVARTPEAVRRHAYRIGAPIIEYAICSGCGSKARKLDDENLCPVCHQRKLADECKERNRAVINEINMQLKALDTARREYDRERQRTARLRRKLKAL